MTATPFRSGARALDLEHHPVGWFTPGAEAFRRGRPAWLQVCVLGGLGERLERKRTLTLPYTVLASLVGHLDEYTRADPEAMVFTAPGGGYLDRNNFRERVRKPAVRAAGCPHVRFHDLRHFAATFAAGSGVALIGLMHRLGHATQKAALIYQHPVDAYEELIAKHIDDRLGEASVTNRL